MTAVHLQDLAQALAGTVWPPDSDWLLTGVAVPEVATSEELVFLLEPRWLSVVQASEAQVVVVDNRIPSEQLPDKHLLRVTHVRQGLAQALTLFYPEHPTPFLTHPLPCVAPTASVAPSAQVGAMAYIGSRSTIGADTKIYPQVYIGANVTIGERCCVYPQAVIYDDCLIGNDVMIHSGAVIGADGYGFYQKNGCHYKIPQVGAVQLEDGVEVGANTTIDRGTVGHTLIGAGTKIDNLVQIGHNVHVGKNCLIVAQTGISGSSRLGSGVTLAGQVGVAGHLTLGDGVVVAGKSGVTKDIPAGLKVSGFPAQEHHQEMRLQALIRKLPQLWQRLTGKNEV